MSFLRKKRNYLSLRIVSTCLAVILALVWMFGTKNLGVPNYFLLFGLLIIGVAIWSLITFIKESKIESDEDMLTEQELIAPTFVFQYCSVCSKAITNKEEVVCPNCGEKL